MLKYTPNYRHMNYVKSQLVIFDMFELRDKFSTEFRPKNHRGAYIRHFSSKVNIPYAILHKTSDSWR